MAFLNSEWKPIFPVKYEWRGFKLDSYSQTTFSPNRPVEIGPGGQFSSHPEHFSLQNSSTETYQCAPEIRKCLLSWSFSREISHDEPRNGGMGGIWYRWTTFQLQEFWDLVEKMTLTLLEHWNGCHLWWKSETLFWIEMQLWDEVIWVN